MSVPVTPIDWVWRALEIAVASLVGLLLWIARDMIARIKKLEEVAEESQILKEKLFSLDCGLDDLKDVFKESHREAMEERRYMSGKINRLVEKLLGED